MLAGWTLIAFNAVAFVCLTALAMVGLAMAFSSGSSFGANPLRQQIGLARATKVAKLEVYWPTSGTTQVFRDLAADQAIEITEFEEGYRKLDSSPLPKP